MMVTSLLMVLAAAAVVVHGMDNNMTTDGRDDDMAKNMTTADGMDAVELPKIHSMNGTRLNGTDVHRMNGTDGISDCVDTGYDENSEMCPTCDNAFKCDNKCIPRTQVCDGIDHCVDRQDEHEMHCRVPCRVDDQYQCIVNGIPGCIPATKLCDGYTDCDSGDDEATGICINPPLRSNMTDSQSSVFLNRLCNVWLENRTQRCSNEMTLLQTQRDADRRIWQKCYTCKVKET